jgi:hypothetical protein
MTSTMIITENSKGQQRINGKGRWLKPINVWRYVRDFDGRQFTSPGQSFSTACILVNAEGRQESYLAEWCGWSRGDDANARAEVNRATGKAVLVLRSDESLAPLTF